jgi:hypothetical protein
MTTEAPKRFKISAMTDDHKRKIGEANKISKKLFYETERGKEYRRQLSEMYKGKSNPQHSRILMGNKMTQETRKK